MQELEDRRLMAVSYCIPVADVVSAPAEVRQWVTDVYGPVQQYASEPDAVDHVFASTFDPTRPITNTNYPAAFEDGQTNQRDFLVSNLGQGNFTEPTVEVPRTVRVAVGLPVPTPSNPHPTVTPAMVDAALTNGRDATIFRPVPISQLTVAELRAALLARI